MKIVYIDMDGVLANFSKGVGRPYQKGTEPPEMMVKGFFRNLKVMPGAREAIDYLLAFKGLSLYVASKPTTKNMWSTIEKYKWIEEHFPSLLKKIFLTCDKGHLNGHYLVDDDPERWGKKFKGILIPFDENQPFFSWDRVIETLKEFKDESYIV